MTNFDILIVIFHNPPPLPPSPPPPPPPPPPPHPQNELNILYSFEALQEKIVCSSESNKKDP